MRRTALVFGLLVFGCEGSIVPGGVIDGREGPGSGEALTCAPAETLDPGRVTMRRLNRVEYDNTVRDLLDDATKPATDFPADDFGHGFNNIADVLSTAPVLVEKYDLAAKALAEAVIAKEATPGQTTRVQAEDGAKSTGAAAGEFWNLYSNGTISSQVNFVTTGRYTFRVRAAQTAAGTAVNPNTFKGGDCNDNDASISPEACSPVSRMAPTTATAAMALVSDISGECRSGETRRISWKPRKAASMKTNSRSVVEDAWCMEFSPVRRGRSAQQPLADDLAALCKADGLGDFVFLGQHGAALFLVPERGEEVVEVARKQR